MKPSLLSWICSVLTLHSVSSADEPPSFAKLPNEMQLAIVQRFVVSQKVEFCDYVDWLAVNWWAFPYTEVGITMLAKVAKEEEVLDLDNGQHHARRQRILKSVRTFFRIHSELPIDCKGISPEELERLAKVFESSYKDGASYSESPTWKKACMAGLFGRNTLVTLLPHLSDDLCSHNKDLLLQTAFFIGDIDSLKGIAEFFGIPKENWLNMVSKFEIVFSGSVPFLEELVECLPNLMKEQLGLIREASFLNRSTMLKRILEEANPVEPHELEYVLDSFFLLKVFKNDSLSQYYTGDTRLYYFLILAARQGHLPIIRFLWPAMAMMSNGAEGLIKEMLTEAGRKDYRSMLEFLLWQSGGDYMKMAQHYVNDAFEGAVGGGHIEIMRLLTGKSNDGTFIFPHLGLTTLSWKTLDYAIRFKKNWSGIEYLVDLKNDEDPRFADFELVDQENAALCIACGTGNYDLVDYLLQKALNGQFIFPLTNPTVRNNAPLLNACSIGNLQIVQKLMERDGLGNYIYEGIDPSRGIPDACARGHFKVLDFFFSTNDVGEYVLPGMNSVDFTSVLLAAITRNQMDSLKWLLRRNKVGDYVLPGMNSVNFTNALSTAIRCKQTDKLEWLLRMNKVGEYVLPGMKSVDFTSVLSAVIEWKQMDRLRWLLCMNKVGEYLFPGMKSVDFTSVLSAAIKWKQTEMVRFLLKMEDEKYVLPGMNGIDFTGSLLVAIKGNQRVLVKWLLSVNNFGEYVLPGMNGVNFTGVLLAAIECYQVDSLDWLLSMKEVEEYVLPRLTGVDLSNVLSAAIKWYRKHIVKWLLRMNECGEYALPRMNSVDFTSVLLAAIMWYRKHIVKWLLRMNECGEYALPRMNSVDFTRVLLDLIKSRQMDNLKWLLSMKKDGKYVLPGMKDVNFTEIVLAAIKWKKREIVQLLLERSDGKYVLPEMDSVDLTLALSTAIETSYEKTDMEIVEFLLKQSPDGSYLLPGVKVTEDMLGINDGLSELRDLLEMHLGPPRTDA